MNKKPSLRKFLQETKMEVLENLEALRSADTFNENCEEDKLNYECLKSQLNLLNDIIKLCVERNYF